MKKVEPDKKISEQNINSFGQFLLGRWIRELVPTTTNIKWKMSETKDIPREVYNPWNPSSEAAKDTIATMTCLIFQQ